jgi:hypothetical protein
MARQARVPGRWRTITAALGALSIAGAAIVTVAVRGGAPDLRIALRQAPPFSTPAPAIVGSPPAPSPPQAYPALAPPASPADAGAPPFPPRSSAGTPGAGPRAAAVSAAAAGGPGGPQPPPLPAIPLVPPLLSSVGTTATGSVLHPVTGTLTTLSRPVASALRARSPGDRPEPTARAVLVLEMPDHGPGRGGARNSGMPLMTTAMWTATAWGLGAAWQEVVRDGWPVPG